MVEGSLDAYVWRGSRGPQQMWRVARGVRDDNHQLRKLMSTSDSIEAAKRATVFTELES